MLIVIRWLAALGVVTLLAGAAPGKEGERATALCPGQLAVDEKPLNLPGEWKWEGRALRHRLIGVDFFEEFDGARETLVPAQGAGKNGGMVNVWRFPSAGGARGIVCIYENTGIRLMRALPDGVSECRVALDPQAKIGGLPEVKRVSCDSSGKP